MPNQLAIGRSVDGEDMFTTTHTCNKCFPNLTFRQQRTLLKIPDAVSKWMVFPGWEVRNQTERTCCDGSLWLNLHDPRCLFKDFLKRKESFFPSTHESIHLDSKMKVLCYYSFFFFFSSWAVEITTIHFVHPRTVKIIYNNLSHGSVR